MVIAPAISIPPVLFWLILLYHLIDVVLADVKLMAEKVVPAQAVWGDVDS